MNVTKYDSIISFLRYTSDRSCRIIHGCISKGIERNRKRDGSIVTNADMAVEDFLREVVGKKFPDFYLITEESTDDKSRLDKSEGFIFDNVDGSSTLGNENDYCFLGAYIENGVAKAGIISRPSSEQKVVGILGYTPGIEINNEFQAIPKLKSIDLENAVASHPRNRGSNYEGLYESLGIKYRNVLYSACMGTRMMQLITQESHLITALTSYLNEWDVAAGVPIMESMGIHVSDRYGKKLKFNNPSLKLESGVIMIHPDIKTPVIKKIKRHYNGGI